MRSLGSAVLALLAAATPKSAVDLHLHVSMSQAAKPLFHGEPDDGSPMASSPSQVLVNQVSSESLLASNVRLALGTVWPPAALRAGKSKRDVTVDQLIGLRRFTERHPAFAFTPSVAEARRAMERGQVALIPTVEGAEGITQASDVDLYYAAGARCITVVHILDSDLGGSAKGQVTHAVGIMPSGTNDRGLSPLGREAVKRMIQLGILIDLAHASDKTMADILDIAEAAQVPVINTHAGARAYIGLERNLDDRLATRIVKGGGVLGVTLNKRFTPTSVSDEPWPKYVHGSCDDIVRHWLHFATLAGAQNVMLGSDFNGFIKRSEPGGSCADGIRNTGDLAALFAALEAHGIPKDAVDGMGERLLTLFEAVDAKADPAAQAQAKKRKVETPGDFDVPL